MFILVIIFSKQQSKMSDIFDDGEMTEKATTSRFASTSVNDLEKKKKDRIPKNTQAKVMWALKLFKNWHNEWKARLDGPLKVLKDFEEMTLSELDYVLQFFVCDVRKMDGNKYPPRTLKEIFAALQHYVNYSLKKKVSFFNDAEFLGLREALDAEMKLSASEGNVRMKRKSDAISFETEDSLWNLGAFGSANPQQLIDTLLYNLGLHLSLRACAEHRNLEYGENSQLSLQTNENGKKCIKYVERCSKNKTFGLKNCKMEPKVTYIYENEKNPSRCVVHLYELYISLRPESNGLPGCEAFYLTPIKSPKQENNCWYKSAPMGINTIAQTLKRLTNTVGDGKLYTNTSLRRTAKTRVVAAGVPKEIAAKKTGHLSNADLSYVECDEVQQKKMSDVLYGTTSTFNLNNTNHMDSHLGSILNNNTFNNCSIAFNFHNSSHS